MGNEDVKKKRGRPIGYKLSTVSKEKIRQKRLGTHHSETTKDKISLSLKAHFKKKDKLSDCMRSDYMYVSGEADEWICDNSEAIDESELVVTEKRLLAFQQMELSIGHDIENFFGHNTTPEFLILVKEELQKVKGADMTELYSLI